MEVILGLGIMTVALFALISVCSMSLKMNRQSVANLGAVQVADAELGRIVTQSLNDVAGKKALMWGAEHSYPSTVFEKGVRQMGGNAFNYAIYEQDVPGLGSAANSNRVCKVDVYVWWTEPGQAGFKLTSCSRLVNEGDTP
jgi:hypothetical protein